MNILIAEDDLHIREGLTELLETEGYHVTAAADGRQALSQFNTQTPDLVLLDIMMPNVSGYDVCREIRKTNEHVPVIFISAKSEEIDRVVGLELGADDYIMKPFGVREVLARIRAVTRRSQLSNQATTPENRNFNMNGLEISPNELRARRGETTIDLSPRDLAILKALYDNSGNVLDRDTLFNHGWGRDYLPSSRTLDQHIAALRKRIETDQKNPTIIKTVHGVGYRYDPA